MNSEAEVNSLCDMSDLEKLDQCLPTAIKASIDISNVLYVRPSQFRSSNLAGLAIAVKAAAS